MEFMFFYIKICNYVDIGCGTRRCRQENEFREIVRLFSGIA